MLPYGSDRARVAGGRVVLHSRLAKGWTPRTPKSGTHAEFPGTAVLWDDQYYEVLSAEPLPAGGVRYELAPWRDDHTIRVFSVYDAASEAALQADYAAAALQRKRSGAARMASVVLGHLPERAQVHLADELGLSPARMTLVSTIPAVVLVGVCVWLSVDARLRLVPSPVPVWLWIFALIMFADSAARFQTVMSQNRGMGSVVGTLFYGLYELATRKTPPAARAPAVVREEDPERDLRDAVEMRSWLFTLLPVPDQQALARRFGYDYRRDAYSLAYALLAVGMVGVISSVGNAAERLSAAVSLAVALVIVAEQLVRISALRRGPAGSLFGWIVRPFVRRFLQT